MQGLNLPKAPGEWRIMADREIIQPPPRKRSTEASRERPIYHPDLHVGEKAIDVPLVNLAGWNSASKVQLAHFLTTRTLIRIADLGLLTDQKNYEEFHLTKDICRKSRQWLDNYADWHTYLRDVKFSKDKAPEPGKAPRLGEFGNVRYHQLQARLFPKKQDPVPEQRPMRPRIAISYAEEEGGDRAADRMELDLIDSERLSVSIFTRNSSRDSAFSIKIPAEDEEIINIGFVDFLVSVTKSCEDVGLDWDGVRALLDTQIGNARLSARSDGRLHPRWCKDIFALLEVKPFRLEDNPDSTFMQMVLQLLCWMISENFSKEHPYIMFSAHREHVYLTVAVFGDGYPDYILNGKIDNPEDCFLTLKCYGPFSVYHRSEVKFFGELALALGMMCSKAWKVQQERG